MIHENADLKVIYFLIGKLQCLLVVVFKLRFN